MLLQEMERRKKARGGSDMDKEYTAKLEELAAEGAIFDDGYDSESGQSYEQPHFVELMVSPIEINRVF